MPTQKVQGLAQLLMQFSRLAARAEVAEVLLPLLSEAAVSHVGADAAGVLKLSPDGTLELFASHGLPESTGGWSMDFDAIDAEIGEQLKAQCDGSFDRAYTLPLMSHQAVFGALVLLYEKGHDLDEAHSMLAESLVDLAAITMGRAHQYSELQRAYDELRESREAQARTYKLGVLGQLAAGVSHDLKNILNPLKIYLQLLERQVAKADEGGAKDSIQEMHEVITRGVETIDRLREFSRQEPIEDAAAVDINAHVEEAVKLSRARLVSTRAYQIALRTKLGEPPTVRVVPAELISAVVNVIVNAIDAMQDAGSEILVTTGKGEGQAWIRIADDGPGIPDDLAKRVFEPFFSTKGDKGTGLGLANVYAFARRHGGKVELDTSVEKGAAFTITLPAPDAT